MDLFEIYLKRYSVRAYKPDIIPEDVLQKVLDAAIIAPTAANKQPFQIILIHTAGREEELKRIYKTDWFVQPPLVICFCGIPEQGWVRRMDNMSYTLVDVAIVADHLILAATALGLGTCWIAAFDINAAREVLGLPENVQPVIFTPLGYPADNPRGKIRKPLGNLVRYEQW